MVDARRIIQTGDRMQYIAAYKAAAGRGGLPRNADFLDTLVLTDRWRGMGQSHKAFGGEVYAYPEFGKAFQRSQVMEDSVTRLTLVDVSKHIPESEFTGPGNENTVLIVTAIKEFGYENGRDILVPAAITLARNVARSVMDMRLEIFGDPVVKGMVIDMEDDCLPRLATFQELEGVDPKLHAWFWTIKGQGVRSLVRCLGDDFDKRRDVHANISHRSTLIVVRISSGAATADGNGQQGASPPVAQTP